MKRSLHRSPSAHKLAEAPASYLTLPADAIEAAREVCERYAGGVHRGGGIPAVAAKIGAKAGVLYNKLSPSEDSYNRLSVTEFILIGLVTGAIAHLQVLARTMNCVAFPVPDFSKCSDQALLELLGKVQMEAGDYHRVLVEALQRNGIDAGELAKLEKEVFEWLGAVVEAHARVKGLARV